jgi:hypothetical protein
VAAPPPPPSGFSISAPARASIGASAAASVFAGPDNPQAIVPNFTDGHVEGTSFPLLQTVMIYDADRAGPDLDARSSGRVNVEGGMLKIDVPNFTANPRESALYPNLDWALAGYWATGGGAWDYDDVVGRHAVFVVGYETPAAAMPMTGSATYRGSAQGFVFFTSQNIVSSGAIRCGCVVMGLSGESSFTADFGARTVDGSLTNMRAGGGERWNDVGFSSTISGNAFSGVARVMNAPGGSSTMVGTGTGTIEGKFFGPSAQEAGAVWTLFDGTRAAIGTLSGKRP